jgi:hypothetical protein
MLEKVKVLYNFEKGMTIAAVKTDYNEIMYTNIQQDATIMSWFYFKISSCFRYMQYSLIGVQSCSWQSLV